jgi:hypothetical protein
VYAIPTAVVALRDPKLGIPLAVGVLPAALVGIPPRRRARLIILVFGVLAGASMFLGGVLAHLPLVLAAILLAAAVVGAALLASALAFGRIVLVLCAPLVAVGLSYDDYESSAQTLLLLCLGAAYACLVAMLWPAHAAHQRPQPQLPDQKTMFAYGIRLGLAAAIVYAVAAGMGPSGLGTRGVPPGRPSSSPSSEAAASVESRRSSSAHLPPRWWSTVSRPRESSLSSPLPCSRRPRLPSAAVGTSRQP